MTNSKQQAIYQYSAAYFFVLILSSIFTKIFSGAGVFSVWCWYLIPGYLLTYFIKRDLTWFTRLPFALGIGVGLFSPITIIAILFRFNLNVYLGLFILCYILVALAYYFFAPESSTPHTNTGNGKISNWPFIIFMVLLIGGLTYLSLLWPLAGDDLAGLPLYSEVLAQEKITGSEPFHGSGTPVTPRNELVVQGYQMIMLAKVGDLIPNDLFIFSRAILIILSFLAVYTFVAEWYQNKKFAQLILGVWGVYLLSTLHFDKDGSNFVTRIYQDKFSGWFVVIPVLLTLFIWYMRDKNKSDLVFLAVGSLGLALTHPVTFMILLILIGSYSILHLWLNFSREELFKLIGVGLVMAACLLVPIVQYIRYIGPMPIDIAGLSDAVTFSRSFMAVNRFRLLFLENGSYILHPITITQPLVLIGLLVSIFLVPETRKSDGTKLAISAMVIISIVLYIPFLANIMGRITTPYLLWRLAWPYSLLSILIIIEAALKAFDHISEWVKSSNQRAGIKRFKEVVILIITIAIALPSLNSGITEFSQRISEINYSPCSQAEKVLIEIESLTRNQALNVLASPKLNLCIPGVAGLANVIEYRGLGTVNRLPEDELTASFQRIEDVNIFTNSTMVNQLVVDILKRYEIDLILIERDRSEFELQLANMPESFNQVYTDEQYALYQIVKLPKESLIVAGNEALRLRDWNTAKEFYFGELESNESQILAYLGLANAYTGQGDLEESLNYLLLAQWYAPEEAEIYAQLSETYLLLQDLENSIANLEIASELSPSNENLWISLGTLKYFAGDKAEALKNLEKGFSLQAEFGTVNYYTKLANHLTKINWEEEATNNYQRAYSITSDPVILTNHAASLAQMNETSEAIRAAEQAAKNSRWDYRPLLLLGQIFQEIGDEELAVEMYQKVLVLNPYHSYAYTELAKIKQENSGDQAALEFVQTLEGNNPSLPGPHTALATLYLMQGDTDNALKEYQKVQKIMPRNASIDTIMGYLNLIAEDYEEANKLFADILEENPQSAPTILGLAKIYSLTNDSSQELGLRYQIVKENPLSVWPHISLARTFSRYGNWQKAEDILAFSINLNPQEASAWVMLGDFYMTRGDWPNAQIAYFEAQTLDPNNADILIRMGRSYWFAGNLPAAIRYLEEAIIKNPNLNEAHLALANVLWLSGSDDRSIALVDEMLKQNTLSIADLNTAIQLIKRQGRIEKAEELYAYVYSSYSKLSSNFPELADLEISDFFDTQFVLEIEESLDNNTTPAKILVEGAQFFNDLGNWEAAQNALLLARSLAPDDPSIYIAEANNYRVRGDKEQVKVAINQAPELFPNSAEIYLWLADLAVVQSDLESAARHLQTAKNLDPNLLDSSFLLANLYRAEGKFDLAISLLEETRRDNPGSAEALLNLIDLELFIGKIEDVKNLLQSGLELFPTDSSLLIRAGDLYLQLGEYDQAEQHYQRSISVNPENIQAYLALGIFYEQRDRTEDALKSYLTASALDQGNIEATLGLSQYYQRHKNVGSAIEILNSVVNNYPGISRIHIELGDIYLQSFSYQKALNHYKLSCDLNKTNSKCLVGQGEVLLQQGNIDAGEKILQSAIEIAPSSPDAYLVLADLYRNMKRLDDAKRLYQDALTQTLNKSVVYMDQAEMYYLQGDLKTAEEAYLAGWSFTPTSTDVGLDLVHFYKQQNELQLALGVLEKLTTYHPNLCEIEIEAGDLNNLNLDLEAAEQTYLNIINNDPLCAGAYEALSTVYGLQGKPELALQVHKDAVNNIPNSALVLTRLGDYYYSKMMYEEAQSTYQDTLELEANNLDALIGLEKISLATNAEIEYSPTSIVEHTTIISPQKAADLALALQEFFLWDEAYALIEESLKVTPYNSLAWFALGNHYSNNLDYDKALEVYQNALQNPATHLDSLLEISNTYLEMGEIEQAESSYMLALSIYPGSAEPYLALSEFFLQTNQADIAEEILLEGIAHGPKNLSLYEALANLYLDNNKLGEAKEISLIGLENYPGSDGLNTTLGDIYSDGLVDLIDQIENYNAYLWWYEYLYDRVSSQKPSANIQWQQYTDSRLRKIQQEIQSASEGLKVSQTALENFQENIDKAQNAYTAALSLNPSNETALLQLGRLQLILESTNAALPYFQGALTANPNSSATLKSLGFAYLTTDNPEKAVPLFERRIKIDPTQSLSYLGKFRALKETRQEGILLGSELAEVGQFWYENLIQRFRIILETDFPRSTSYEDSDYATTELEVPNLDIPASWQSRQASFDYSTVSTYISPDNHAVVQLVQYEDGNIGSRSVAFEFALALLLEMYGEDIDITRTEVLEDRENLIWVSADNEYAGITGFTIKGNEIIILTLMYDSPFEGDYLDLLTNLSNQVQLGDPVYPLGQ